MSSECFRGDNLFARPFPSNSNLCPGRDLLRCTIQMPKTLPARIFELEALLRKYADFHNTMEISRSAWGGLLGTGGEKPPLQCLSIKPQALSPSHLLRLLPVSILNSFRVLTLSQLTLHLQELSLSEPTCLRKCF